MSAEVFLTEKLCKRPLGHPRFQRMRVASQARRVGSCGSWGVDQYSIWCPPGLTMGIFLIWRLRYHLFSVFPNIHVEGFVTKSLLLFASDLPGRTWTVPAIQVRATAQFEISQNFYILRLLGFGAKFDE